MRYANLLFAMTCSCVFMQAAAITGTVTVYDTLGDAVFNLADGYFSIQGYMEAGAWGFLCSGCLPGAPISPFAPKSVTITSATVNGVNYDGILTSISSFGFAGPATTIPPYNPPDITTLSIPFMFAGSLIAPSPEFGQPCIICEPIFGALSGSGIVVVEIAPLPRGPGGVFQNATYYFSSVPEPGTVTTAVLGLFTMLAFKRSARSPIAVRRRPRLRRGPSVLA
jgi:hypothetical protein